MVFIRTADQPAVEEPAVDGVVQSSLKLLAPAVELEVEEYEA